MEKVNVYNMEGKVIETIDRPNIFLVPPRIDLVQKANEIGQSKKKQAKGRNQRAGLRNTAEGWGTGHGMSRAPRIKGSGFSTARNVGRVPFAKGGRTTHPVKVDKKIHKKINKTTKKLSLISGISATADKDFVIARGHLIANVPEIPLVVDDKIQTIKKTNMIFKILCDLGLKDELYKVKKSKRIKKGKAKRRGRKYKQRRSILMIINEDFGIVKAASNIPGVDVRYIDNISVDDLAPGGQLGRLIIWTQSAFKLLNNYQRII